MRKCSVGYLISEPLLFIMSESLQLKGTLRGHNGWVTQIATNPKYPDMILSCSRGKLKNFVCLYFYYYENRTDF